MSVSYELFSSVHVTFGDSTLSAEPYRVFRYLCIEWLRVCQIMCSMFFGYDCITYHIISVWYQSSHTRINDVVVHTLRCTVGDSILSGRTVYQSKCLQDRVIEARNFVSQFDLSWPVAVDDPGLGDPFNSMYASWPTRFYILLDGKMSFIAQPNMQHRYELGDLKATLLEIVRLGEL